jgi:hypothetical protein
MTGTGSLEFFDANVVPGSWYAYVLGMVEGTSQSGASESFFGPVVIETGSLPRALRIAGNVPNPFNPTTKLQLEVPSRERGSPVRVEVVIFDAKGRPVRTLLRDRMVPGRHAVIWDGRDDAGRPVASGVYVARLAAGGHSAAHKLTLVR